MDTKIKDTPTQVVETGGYPDDHWPLVHESFFSPPGLTVAGMDMWGPDLFPILSVRSLLPHMFGPMRYRATSGLWIPSRRGVIYVMFYTAKTSGRDLTQRRRSILTTSMPLLAKVVRFSDGPSLSFHTSIRIYIVLSLELASKR